MNNKTTKPVDGIIMLSMSILTAIICVGAISIDNTAMQNNDATPIQAEAIEHLDTKQLMAIEPVELVTSTPTPTEVPTPTPEPTPTPYYEVTDEEYEILCRIVEAEATGSTVEQRANVASCVFNRVEGEEWPDTIEGVVFQDGQFSPVSSGRYYNVSITEETREAVDYVLMNGPQHNCIYFCNYACGSTWFASMEEAFRDGIHRYYEG